MTDQNTPAPSPAAPTADATSTPGATPGDRHATQARIRQRLAEQGLDPQTVALLTEDLANIVWGT